MCSILGLSLAFLAPGEAVEVYLACGGAVRVPSGLAAQDEEEGAEVAGIGGCFFGALVGEALHTVYGGLLGVCDFVFVAFYFIESLAEGLAVYLCIAEGSGS